MKNLNTKLALFALFVVVNCAFVHGQGTMEIEVSDTLIMPDNYLMFTINTEGEKGMIIVGDTVKAVLNTVEYLECRNEELKDQLDACWDSQLIQAERYSELFQEMLRIIQ